MRYKIDWAWMFLIVIIVCLPILSVINGCSASQKAIEKKCGLAERLKVEEILSRDESSSAKIKDLLLEVGPEYLACVVANADKINPSTSDAGTHD